MLYKFTIFGPPVGYYSHGARPNYSRLRKYVDYKELVQFLARIQEVVLPLVATKDRPLDIRTAAYFKNGVHPDPENVHKGIVDALFYSQDRKVKGSGDKHTGGRFFSPKYDKNNPRVEVWISKA